MSIIYSYPTSAPTVDDLIIGTSVGDDNATKSFTVQSLVSLINAEAGSGTVTGITIATDAFLRATETSQPGAAAITYTLQLTAAGTPSATTFLRGDNKWIVPTVSSGIGVYNGNILVTNDLSSANFRGAGVTTSSDASGNVIIDIEGAINAVESIVAGTGIGLSGATGNVIVTNTGITGLSQGDGISISTTAGGVSTIATTGQSTGTVTSVSVGAGLSLLSGTSTVNPTIGLDYTGADTYITQPAAAVPLEADFIPFHSITGTAVKKVTFGDIQASTLALVNTSISDTDADNIKNNTDLLPSVNKVLNVITLTAGEYTAIGAGNYVAGTLYLTTTAAQPQNTVNFTINTAAINYTGSCNFTQSTTVNGSVVNPIAVTGSVGSAYSVATTIIPNGASCSLSGGSATQTLTGTIPATPTPAAVTHTLAARTISAPASPGQSTNTMVLDTSAITGAEYTTNAPRTATGTTGGSFPATDFGLVATANTNYEFTGGAATVSGLYTPTASTYGGTSITGYFNATTVSAKDYPVNYTVTPNISGIQNYNITITGGTFSAPATSGSTTAPYNSTVTVKAEITPTGTDIISPNPLEAIGSVVITSSTANTIDLGILAGTISSSSGFVQMNENISASGPGASSVAGAYTYNGATGYVAGTPESGTVGVAANFAATFNYDSSLYFISSSSVNITPTSSPVYATTVAPVTANVTVATANKHTFSSTIAATGGSNTAPGTGGSACNYSGTQVTVYTDTSASSGLSVGQTVYASATSSTGISRNTSSWWKTGAPGGTQLVRFDSSGAVAAIGSC
jgi:hypothetical protein